MLIFLLKNLQRLRPPALPLAHYVSLGTISYYLHFDPPFKKAGSAPVNYCSF